MRGAAANGAYYTDSGAVILRDSDRLEKFVRQLSLGEQVGYEIYTELFSQPIEQLVKITFSDNEVCDVLKREYQIKYAQPVLDIQIIKTRLVLDEFGRKYVISQVYLTQAQKMHFVLVCEYMDRIAPFKIMEVPK